MEEKSPTRQIGYKGPDGSVTYITVPYKWVNPNGKDPKRILLEISDELNECRHKYQDVSDLLGQARQIVWQNFDNPSENRLYNDLLAQQDLLDSYLKQRSQVRKDEVLREAVNETRFCIDYYFRMGNK